MLEYIPRRILTGGLRLPPRKAESLQRPIGGPFMPRRLVLSLPSFASASARLCVAPGERVLRGQTLMAADEPTQIPDVHAPTSGRVVDVIERAALRGGGLITAVCVVIEPDGEDETAPESLDTSWPTDRYARIEAIRRGGIVGLGGAAYPTASKIGSLRGCKAVILNGAECEPYISCDDALMQRSAEAVVDGGQILCEMTGAELCIIAIETDKPRAVDAVTNAAAAANDQRLRIAQVQSIYPAGGERQLVELLTGIEVPTGQFASDIGYLCVNVGTAYAISRKARHGEPLLSRIVTVTGSGVKAPQNVEALIGTPIEELIEYCGGYTDDVERLIVGGNMMGIALPDDSFGITKSTNCVLAAARGELADAAVEWPCIRCGECASACPAHLLPQELLRAARASDHASLESLGLRDCIECGCCDVVCPSHIRLTQSFRDAKTSLRRFEQHRELAEQAQRRVEERSARAEHDAQRELEQQSQLLDELGRTQAERARAIAAAVDRHRRRKSNEGSDS